MQMVKERHLETLTKHWRHLKDGVGPFKEDMEALLSSLADKMTEQPEGKLSDKGTSGFGSL